MPQILGHRGLSAKHLENSMEAFRAALAAGMDGFELDVQPTQDGVCMVLHDEDLARTAEAGGILRRMRSSDVPRLKNGEALPRLADVLDLPARVVNVELKGEPGWKQALATVEAAGALDRVIFSSFEPSEVLQLWAACPEARCGFLYETEEALELGADEIADLPETLLLHLPLEALLPNRGFWAAHAHRLVVWGLDTPARAQALGFEPAFLIVDGL